MSKISKEGYDQIQVIKSALNSMFDKLNGDFYSKTTGKVKDIEKVYSKTDVFEVVKEEFETIMKKILNPAQYEDYINNHSPKWIEDGVYVTRQLTKEFKDFYNPKSQQIMKMIQQDASEIAYQMAKEFKRDIYSELDSLQNSYMDASYVVKP